MAKIGKFDDKSVVKNDNYKFRAFFKMKNSPLQADYCPVLFIGKTNFGTMLS